MKIVQIMVLAVIGAWVLTDTCQAKYVDDKADLVYYGYRYYSPTLGRWLNRDPLAGPSSIGVRSKSGESHMLIPWEFYVTGNLYEYIYNAPMNFIDPDGLWGVGVIGTGGYEVGVGPVGSGLTGSIGGGYFSGGGLGGFASGGFFAGQRAGAAITCPPFNQNPWTGGAYTGIGAGGFLSNANKPGDLSGPFKQWNITTPWFGLSLGWSSGTWIVSGTVEPGLGGSISGYPTSTATTH